MIILPTSSKHSRPSRDLLAEMSSIISAHQMHMRMLHANSIKEDNTQNQQENPPKLSKKAYQKSPLSKEVDLLMPTSKVDEDHVDIEDFNSDEIVSVKIRKYNKNNNVAYHCQKLLKITAYPSVTQLAILIHQISQQSDGIGLNEIKSLVLLWFRKRREYLAKKVYSACDDLMLDVWETKTSEESDSIPLSYDQTVNLIISDTILMEKIVKISKLPVKDEVNALDFVRKKVGDYFMKLCSKT